MGLPQLQTDRPRLYTVEEYLAINRRAEERLVFIDSEIFTMRSESEAHSDICINLVGILHQQLRNTTCHLRSKGTIVRSSHATESKYGTTKGFFTYPDVLAVCGERQYLDEYKDVLLNSKIIIEVLSEKTEKFDRGEKFQRHTLYLDSLCDYVLVEQKYPHIEQFHRQGDETWLYSTVTGLEDTFHLAAINCRLKMSDIYDRVEFPPEPDEPQSPFI